MARPTAEEWMKWLLKAQQYKEDFGQSKRWPTYRNYYRGKFPQWNYNTDAGGILPFNITYGMARALIPNLYFRNPYITVTPRSKPNLERHANMLEAIDNHLIQEMGLKKTIKTGLLDNFLLGRGIFKIGYDSEFGFAEKDIVEELGLKSATNTRFARGKKNEEGASEAIEYNVNIKPGMPWVQRVDPENFLVPFGVRTLQEAPWADHIIIRSLDDLKKDIKYKNTSELSGTHIDNAFSTNARSEFFQRMSEEMDLVEMHEIRDAKYREIVTVVNGETGGIIRGPVEDPLQIEGLPFVDIVFNEDPEYYWAPSDAAIMEPQQLEINETRTQTMLHRRVSLIKFLVQEGAISEVEISKMFSEGVAPVVRVKGDPRSAVHAVQPHIPIDQIQWAEVIRSDTREMIGLGRNQLGESSRSSRQTATESQIVQQAHDIRLGERRDIIADAITEIMRKVNQVIFKYWSKPQTVRVVGVDASVYWIDYQIDEIVGEYDVKIDVESLVPHTKALKRQEIMQLIQALGKNPNANIDYLMKQLVREFDYLDAVKILPDAKETANEAMPFGQFQQQQQRLLDRPREMRKRTEQNAAAVGRTA